MPPSCLRWTRGIAPDGAAKEYAPFLLGLSLAPLETKLSAQETELQTIILPLTRRVMRWEVIVEAAEVARHSLSHTPERLAASPPVAARSCSPYASTRGSTCRIGVSEWGKSKVSPVQDVVLLGFALNSLSFTACLSEELRASEPEQSGSACACGCLDWWHLPS